MYRHRIIRVFSCTSTARPTAPRFVTHSCRSSRIEVRGGRAASETRSRSSVRTAPPASVRAVSSPRKTSIVSSTRRSRSSAPRARRFERTHDERTFGRCSSLLRDFDVRRRISEDRRRQRRIVGHGSQRLDRARQIQFDAAAHLWLPRRAWSGELQRAVGSGQRFVEVIVDDGTTRYTFKNVMLTSFQPGLTPAPSYIPLATFTFVYGSYSMTRRAITTPTPALG